MTIKLSHISSATSGKTVRGAGSRTRFPSTVWLLAFAASATILSGCAPRGPSRDSLAASVSYPPMPPVPAVVYSVQADPQAAQAVPEGVVTAQVAPPEVVPARPATECRQKRSGSPIRSAEELLRDAQNGTCFP